MSEIACEPFNFFLSFFLSFSHSLFYSLCRRQSVAFGKSDSRRSWRSPGAPIRLKSGFIRSFFLPISFLSCTHARTHTRTLPRTPARTHARKHARTHASRHNLFLEILSARLIPCFHQRILALSLWTHCCPAVIERIFSVACLP